MNYNLLNQKGFIHFKNIFDINEVENYFKYIKSIDYNKKIFHTKEYKYKSLKNYLLGHNPNVSNKNSCPVLSDISYLGLTEPDGPIACEILLIINIFLA